MPKLYLAGAKYDFMRKEGDEKTRKLVPSIVVEGRVQRILFSYFYDGFERQNRPSDDIVAYHKHGLDLFLDSGAFTGFSKQKLIPLERYADFCVAEQHRFNLLSSLDHIGSGEEAARKSYENFQELRKRGANVTPVFHVREPDEWMQRYIDEGHEHIFIGGMVPETTKWLQERLDGLFAGILTDDAGLPRSRYHGFGVTSWQLLRDYPWFSVDSTAWLMRAIYGMVVAPMSGRYVDVTVSADSPRKFDKNSWHVNCMTPPQMQYIQDWLSGYGVEIKDLEKSGRMRSIVNAITYQQMESSIPDRFTKPVAMTLF